MSDKLSAEILAIVERAAAIAEGLGAEETLLREIFNETERDAPAQFGARIAGEIRALAPSGPALLEQQKQAWLKELYANPAHHIFGISISDLAGIINELEEANIPVNAKALEQVRKDARLEEHKKTCDLCCPPGCTCNQPEHYRCKWRRKLD